ncbi:MAG: hypothetical protein RI535_02930 [Psychroflexus sp.]|nr:hypothetical protein [Psychroflexus sp.]
MATTKKLFLITKLESKDHIFYWKLLKFFGFKPPVNCDLTRLTGSFSGQKTNWLSFLKSLGVSYELLPEKLYQQRFKSKFEGFVPAPAILLQDNYELSTLISNADLRKMDTLDELTHLIDRRL